MGQTRAQKPSLSLEAPNGDCEKQCCLAWPLHEIIFYILNI